MPDKLKGKEKLSYIYSDLIDLSDTKLSTGIGASNGWVISGKHTKSGKPIIAGDPHLTASIPGPLLLVNMSIKDYEFFSAAFLPGSIGTCSFINKNLAYTTTA